jgi:hypothetical protein
MLGHEKYQTTSEQSRDQCWFLGFRTEKGAAHGEEKWTDSGKDDYDARVSLINRAFREISRLCFECDYTPTREDWRVLDEARLDDPALSYAEVRERLAMVYRRIKRACLEKARR